MTLQIEAPQGPLLPHCVNGMTTLYYDDNFQGDSRVYGLGTIISDLTGDGDEYSSVCVPDGVRLVAYEDENFADSRLTIIGPLQVNDLDHFNISGRQLRDWGDEIDSLRVEVE